MIKTSIQADELCQRLEKLADLAVDLMKTGLVEDMVRYELFNFAKRQYGWASNLEEAWAYADAAMALLKIKLIDQQDYKWVPPKDQSETEP